MTETYINIDNLQWVPTPIIKKHADGPLPHPYLYELELFQPLASWDIWDYWEKERIASMQQHIKQGDTVFDVGAEQGWMSALISKYMSNRIVLFEPTREFWPGIKAIFERNNLRDPTGSYIGFAGETSTEKNIVSGWPTELSDDVIEKRKYRNMWDDDDMRQVSSIKIDDCNIVPDHITIDVEGAELKVLEGAYKTLKKYRPKVWCSVHPDMLERDYGKTKEDLLFFMGSLGYEAELLAVDHEHHYMFSPMS